eukprot:m.31738 g.31738  ORF g.31738 m.31738 type:complete len:173 (+) comp12097_c0_seq2:147-665(+)
MSRVDVFSFVTLTLSCFLFVCSPWASCLLFCILTTFFQVRLKSEGSEGKYVYKQMVVFFWDDVDHRMKSLGDVDRSMVQESTRELFSMFHGLLFAYDEGLEGDDTVLAAALWRNLFHDSKTDLNVEDLASMVAYVRREMAALDMVDAEQLIGEGKHTFGPRPEAAHIKAKTA